MLGRCGHSWRVSVDREVPGTLHRPSNCWVTRSAPPWLHPAACSHASQNLRNKRQRGSPRLITILSCSSQQKGARRKHSISSGPRKCTAGFTSRRVQVLALVYLLIFAGLEGAPSLIREVRGSYRCPDALFWNWKQKWGIWVKGPVGVTCAERTLRRTRRI